MTRQSEAVRHRVRETHKRPGKLLLGLEGSPPDVARRNQFGNPLAERLYDEVPAVFDLPQRQKSRSSSQRLVLASPMVLQIRARVNPVRWCLASQAGSRRTAMTKADIGTVLITGAQGNLGRKLIAHLVAGS